MIYEKENDDLFLNVYKVAWIIVAALGIIGLFLIFGDVLTSINVGFIQSILTNIFQIIFVVSVLTAVAIGVGWLQVAITSKLGEEVVLLVTWVTPILVILTSLYLYSQSQDVNVLGGAAAGSLFFILVVYFRKSLRLSARLIEVGAEVATVHPSMFVPQLIRVVATAVLTILVFPGLLTVFSFSAQINPFLAIILTFIYVMLYSFCVAAFGAFADASNIAFVNLWYDGTKPSSSKATDQIKRMKAPIVRFAFLMAFINRFRSNRRGFTPGRLFQYMNFSNWPKLLLGGRRVTSTAASAAAYFGSYTLVVIMVNKSRSVAAAYKASAKAVFERFVENVAGSIGFNILESLRSFFSAILMLAAGAIYGYVQYSGDITYVIIFAIIFFLGGYFPLNAMFKPVVNGYRLILYRAQTGSLSKNLDSKTKDIIKQVIK